MNNVPAIDINDVHILYITGLSRRRFVVGAGDTPDAFRTSASLIFL